MKGMTAKQIFYKLYTEDGQADLFKSAAQMRNIADDNAVFDGVEDSGVTRWKHDGFTIRVQPNGMSTWVIEL